MKLNSKILGVIVLVVMMGGIMISSALNLYQTVGTKVPVTYKEGEAAGQYNPADIRGSYLWVDVNKYFGIPLEDLRKAFNLPADFDMATQKMNVLETMYAGNQYEIGVGSVRVFVAMYNGLPFDLATVAYVPKEAAQILKAKGKLTPETTAYLDKITVDVKPVSTTPAPASTPAPAASTPAPAKTESSQVSATAAAVDKSIKGKTTFQDLITWGMKKDAIEKILGGPMPAESTVIKDYCTSKNIDFETLKTSLQTEVDKTK